MSPGVRGEIVLAMAWLLFPMLPVILEEFYYQLCVNLLGSTRAGPDPHAWAWGTWLVMLGPLVGYGFLAGSTAEVPDEVSGPKKGLRRVLARRAVWVAIGPWAGFLFVLAAFLGFGYLSSWFPPPQDQNVPRPSSADPGIRGADMGLERERTRNLRLRMALAGVGRAATGRAHRAVAPRAAIAASSRRSRSWARSSAASGRSRPPGGAFSSISD